MTGTTALDPPQDPGDIGFCLSVRRETLDAILVGRARREPTVEVLEHTIVESLLVDDGRVIGAVIVGDDGSQLLPLRNRDGRPARRSRRS